MAAVPVRSPPHGMAVAPNTDAQLASASFATDKVGCEIAHVIEVFYRWFKGA